MIGAVSVGDQHGEPEVSYVFVPEVWGRGLAGEALTALLGWLWSETSHASVIAVTQTANARSCQLLERLGFTFEREFVEWNAAQSQYRLDRS
jgi:RimJ/RimL family protein N-acetyltransferase